jgi:uncharacterized membrane protein
LWYDVAIVGFAAWCAGSDLMGIVKLVLKWVLGLFFIGAGVNHFMDEAFYMKIMPDYIPQYLHRPAVIASGIAEVLLGALLLVPQTQRLAAWGLIALLIAVFPANIYMYQHRELFPEVDPTALLVRLPLQGLAILWAWWYTRPSAPKIGYAPKMEI